MALIIPAPTYLHTLSPFAVQFTENFGIRWYGLSYLAGFISAYWIISYFARRHLTPLPDKLVGDFIFTVAVGTILGGRLGYCLFYSPELFAEISSSPPWWGVLAINRGGMASHGGIIGVICAAFFFGWKHKLPGLHLLDMIAFTGPIGIFFGRCANFVNGELVGRAAPESLPWAVKFPQDLLSYGPHQLETLKPVLEQSSLSSYAAQWSELIAQAPFSSAARGQIDSILLTLINELHKSVNPLLRDAISAVLVPRHPSQLYEAGTEGILLFSILVFLWRIPRKSGFIAAWFLILYSIARIFCEMFRMPDPQIGYQIFGLTRGQILSFALPCIGIGVLIGNIRRKDTATYGGWLRKD